MSENVFNLKFGICIPNYGVSESPIAIERIAVEAENLGFDSLWATDHILMSKNSGTPYEKIVDSLVTLAYLASKTTRVRLGVSCLIVGMRNPVVVAKQLASIDELSGGRVLASFAAGWNEGEFSSLGSNFHNRGKRLNETIRLVRSLWHGETEFESKRLSISFKDAVFEPSPKSKEIEIWIGGASEPAMKRAIELGDAWHPNAAPLEQFRELISKFRAISPNGKSKPICIRIALDTRSNQSEVIGTQGSRRLILSGNMSKNKEILEEFEKMGVSYAVLVPSPDGKISLEHQQESLQRFAKECM